MEYTHIIITICPLIVAWILDLIFGDPNSSLHPIVIFGKCISRGEKWLNRKRYRKVKGSILTGLLIASTFIIFSIIAIYLHRQTTIGYFVFATISIYFFLAGKTLRKEVNDVFVAVDNSLDLGRKQVGRIVGRDPSQLSEQEIKTAALETLSENLSDGVVAPLFWYLLLGIPGIATYKMINTLDSMIAYKTERYRQFGFIAAKLDDLVNYIPARITALLMLIVSNKLGLICKVFKNGKQHISPNSGYPEAALAYLLNCQFGGPHIYFGELIPKPYIGEHNRVLTLRDAKYALRINLLVEILSIFIVVLAQITLILI